MKESACQCRRQFDPWVRKIPLGGHGNPLQYSCLKNPIDRGAWWATVHGFAKSLSTMVITDWEQLPRVERKTYRDLVLPGLSAYPYP